MVYTQVYENNWIRIVGVKRADEQYGGTESGDGSEGQFEEETGECYNQ